MRVPFGHQRLDGVVVGLADASELPAERLVAPSAVREDSVPPDLVELALWMAAEYASTPARALSLVLPPPGKPRHAAVGARAPRRALDGERLTERQRALLERLPRPGGRGPRLAAAAGDARAGRARAARGAARAADARRRPTARSS